MEDSLTLRPSKCKDDTIMAMYRWDTIKLFGLILRARPDLAVLALDDRSGGGCTRTLVCFVPPLDAMGILVDQPCVEATGYRNDEEDLLEDPDDALVDYVEVKGDRMYGFHREFNEPDTQALRRGLRRILEGDGVTVAVPGQEG